jgi:hypothetical protein
MAVCITNRVAQGARIAILFVFTRVVIFYACTAAACLRVSTLLCGTFWAFNNIAACLFAALVYTLPSTFFDVLVDDLAVFGNLRAMLVWAAKLLFKIRSCESILAERVLTLNIFGAQVGAFLVSSVISSAHQAFERIRRAAHWFLLAFQLVCRLFLDDLASLAITARVVFTLAITGSVPLVRICVWHLVVGQFRVRTLLLAISATIRIWVFAQDKYFGVDQ